MQIYMKVDIKSIDWGRYNTGEGQDWSEFYFCRKRCSRRFEWLGDEEASMLWFDGKGVAHFTKSSTAVAEDS